MKPVLTIASGDTVRFRTLDAAWFEFDQPDPFGEKLKFSPRNDPEDAGHCLVGPVAIEGLKAGQVLEVRIKKIVTGIWGWNSAGGFPSWVNENFGLEEGDRVWWDWKLDPKSLTAVNQHGRKLPMRPFMGVMGMPANEEGFQPTPPPRSCGGNIDCKELVEGTVLFLPVAVDGGLFSTGDGHALQGDGEVASPAIECPMELVEMEFVVRSNLSFKNPRALTPAGWVTLGFHEDLNQAFLVALEAMVDLLGELGGFSRKEALAYASLCVDMRVTQVVNGVKGIHALLPTSLFPS
jgi:acetamidase/formamidase